MAIINNAELWWARLDPARPNDKFDKDQPTWEVQIRTKDREEATRWKKDLNLNVKSDEHDGEAFFKVTLKKKSKKRDGAAVDPVKVVDSQLNDIDPNTIGHGSTGNVRVYQYDYDVGGNQGIASMLMAIQITKLIKYDPSPREDTFELLDDPTEVITSSDSFGDNAKEPAETDDLF